MMGSRLERQPGDNRHCDDGDQAKDNVTGEGPEICKIWLFHRSIFS